ncbi:hypothetical protein ACIQ1D_19195 [Lysinibacillus xylanilyticus]|uniref:hypothetical protein n=1 Tax=Lysinibacillus xylanilyticus TaxID=582475 RepID=UPI0037F5E606
MEFLKHIKENDESKKWRLTLLSRYIHEGNTNDIVYSPRKMEGITFGKKGALVGLSVQASSVHRCEPEKTLEDLTTYTEMEIALYNTDGVTTVEELLPECVDEDMIKHLQECFADYCDCYFYVKVEFIEELYHALVEKYGLYED